MHRPTMIRPATPSDMPAPMALADATGMFEGDELEGLAGMLSAYFDGHLDEDHSWVVVEDGGVLPSRQRQVCGEALLHQVEQDLQERGERLLLIETSSLDTFKGARRFYRKHGYDGAIR